MSSTLPADWSQVLADIQKSLDETLAAVEIPPEPEATPNHAQAGAAADRIAVRVRQLDDRAAQAAQTRRELEALVAFESEAISAWLAASAEMRLRLERGTARAIS
jgi:hypothetical protein